MRKHVYYFLSYEDFATYVTVATFCKTCGCTCCINCCIYYRYVLMSNNSYLAVKNCIVNECFVNLDCINLYECTVDCNFAAYIIACLKLECEDHAVFCDISKICCFNEDRDNAVLNTNVFIENCCKESAFNAYEFENVCIKCDFKSDRPYALVINKFYGDRYFLTGVDISTADNDLSQLSDSFCLNNVATDIACVCCFTFFIDCRLLCYFSCEGLFRVVTSYCSNSTVVYDEVAEVISFSINDFNYFNFNCCLCIFGDSIEYECVKCAVVSNVCVSVCAFNEYCNCVAVDAVAFAFNNCKEAAFNTNEFNYCGIKCVFNNCAPDTNIISNCYGNLYFVSIFALYCISLDCFAIKNLYCTVNLSEIEICACIVDSFYNFNCYCSCCSNESCVISHIELKTCKCVVAADIAIFVCLKVNSDNAGLILVYDYVFAECCCNLSECEYVHVVLNVSNDNECATGNELSVYLNNNVLTKLSFNCINNDLITVSYCYCTVNKHMLNLRACVVNYIGSICCDSNCCFCTNEVSTISYCKENVTENAVRYYVSINVVFEVESDLTCFIVVSDNVCITKEFSIILESNICKKVCIVFNIKNSDEHTGVLFNRYGNLNCCAEGSLNVTNCDVSCTSFNLNNAAVEGSAECCAVSIDDVISFSFESYVDLCVNKRFVVSNLELYIAEHAVACDVSNCFFVFEVESNLACLILCCRYVLNGNEVACLNTYKGELSRIIYYIKSYDEHTALVVGYCYGEKYCIAVLSGAVTYCEEDIVDCRNNACFKKLTTVYAVYLKCTFVCNCRMLCDNLLACNVLCKRKDLFLNCFATVVTNCLGPACNLTCGIFACCCNVLVLTILNYNLNSTVIKSGLEKDRCVVFIKCKNALCVCYNCDLVCTNLISRNIECEVCEVTFVHKLIVEVCILEHCCYPATCLTCEVITGSFARLKEVTCCIGEVTNAFKVKAIFCIKEAESCRFDCELFGENHEESCTGETVASESFACTCKTETNFNLAYTLVNCYCVNKCCKCVELLVLVCGCVGVCYSCELNSCCCKLNNFFIFINCVVNVANDTCCELVALSCLAYKCEYYICKLFACIVSVALNGDLSNADVLTCLNTPCCKNLLNSTCCGREAVFNVECIAVTHKAFNFSHVEFCIVIINVEFTIVEAGVICYRYSCNCFSVSCRGVEGRICNYKSRLFSRVCHQGRCHHGDEHCHCNYNR